MPSARHEFLHQFCADSPDLLARLLHIVGFKEDLDCTDEPEELSGDATNLTPASRHADTTVRVVTPRRGAPFVLVIEAQLAKDTAKRYTWPVYVANLRDRHRKEVVLVVICPDEIADWAAEPIDTGHQGWWTTQTTRPIVLSPSRVPLPTQPEALEQDLDYMVFATLLHGHKALGPGILHLRDVLEAIGRVTDPKHQATLASLIGAALASDQDRTIWRQFMSSWTISREGLKGTALGDWVDTQLHLYGEQLEVEAEARRAAKDVLTILRIRNLPLDQGEEARITECRDLDQLERWLTRAATATTTAEVFAEPTVVRPRDAASQAHAASQADRAKA